MLEAVRDLAHHGRGPQVIATERQELKQLWTKAAQTPQNQEEALSERMQ